MPRLLLFLIVVLTEFVKVCTSLYNNSIRIFGVKQPSYDDVGCGINYETNAMYFIDGSNHNYATWNGLNTSDWINGNYSNIVSPSFERGRINTSKLTSIPGFQENGNWNCRGFVETIQCTTQIKDKPYVYIITGIDFNNINLGRSSMLIYDMNSNNYIHGTKYKYAIPGIFKSGF